MERTRLTNLRCPAKCAILSGASNSAGRWIRHDAIKMQHTRPGPTSRPAHSYDYWPRSSGNITRRRECECKAASTSQRAAVDCTRSDGCSTLSRRWRSKPPDRATWSPRSKVPTPVARRISFPRFSCREALTDGPSTAITPPVNRSSICPLSGQEAEARTRRVPARCIRKAGGPRWVEKTCVDCERRTSGGGS